MISKAIFGSSNFQDDQFYKRALFKKTRTTNVLRNAGSRYTLKFLTVDVNFCKIQNLYIFYMCFKLLSIKAYALNVMSFSAKNKGQIICGFLLPQNLTLIRWFIERKRTFLKFSVNYKLSAQQLIRKKWLSKYCLKIQKLNTLDELVQYNFFFKIKYLKKLYNQLLILEMGGWKFSKEWQIKHCLV